ncbi:Na(+)-translocating NADH-quinone reductase subunit C [Cellvibrio sp. PSBB006]|uniref:Na(+)-translocating NADH-quinone reductase subunit C n=1 Tax=Cellvibrio sp. PSBB006 TaxID=1987723 RepID=UPI000B3B1489|nr:Na(+)-translocating NADH-quinone reductase subunit C [Cellvibrio sp. PSBB006]ARU26787.1 Na(+)-translocating NADH-quinone reductase subunit C [Cellvibrio sp. PSBB006]
MSNNDSIKKTIIVTVLLCIVCSVIVSAAAVLLRPAQVANKSLDFKRNILSAAGLLEAGKNVDAIFSERVVTRVVDLKTGKFTDAVDPASYDQRRASKDPSLSTNLSADEDIAKISRREDYSVVYLIQDENEQLQKIILPVKGYGLWSTLYGFLALEADANTVVGLVFYEHAETPGLGGEVDNPVWKAKWVGKEVYDEGDVAISIIKGSVDPSSSNAVHQVDGLSGATLTSRGVHNLLHFWLGDNGYKPFLTNLKNGEA